MRVCARDYGLGVNDGVVWWSLDRDWRGPDNLHCSGPCLDHYVHDVGTSQIGVSGDTRGVDPESKDGL